jgi:hypothetical protein
VHHDGRLTLTSVAHHPHSPPAAAALPVINAPGKCPSALCGRKSTMRMIPNRCAYINRQVVTAWLVFGWVVGCWWCAVVLGVVVGLEPGSVRPLTPSPHLTLSHCE